MFWEHVILIFILVCPFVCAGAVYWGITRTFDDEDEDTVEVTWYKVEQSLCEQATRRPCPHCGGTLTTEGSLTGPYVFCVDCGYGGQD